MGNHTKLTEKERELLAKWKQEGLSNIECARRLGRHKTTIGRELTRNATMLEGTGINRERVYEPLAAMQLAHERKQRAWKAKHPLKNERIFRYVITHLRGGWGPEVIAGRMARDNPDDTGFRIRHEAIYQFIYHPDNQQQALWEYLRRGHKKRRKRSGRKVHRSRIPDRISIHERPESVVARKEFGHWEGDSIVGKGRDHGLHTAYERKSSLIRMRFMERIDSTSAYGAQMKIYQDYPSAARKTTTLDNGKEHVKHKRLEKALGIKTYFADPYSSWQRGGNENSNLWIRYFFPKGTDFRMISAAELQAVEDELNNRPRKRLNYLTPQEVFDLELKGLRS